MLRRSDNYSHTRFAAARRSLEAFDPRSGWRAGIYEFCLFGFKQAWACLFGGLMLALLLGTHLFWPPEAPLARYDFLTLSALAIQAAMLMLRLETLSEAKVIFAFHIVGTVMELFKTQVGSWQYPEAGVLHIASVPLFSGFMYAAVGSYIARVWRIFEFRFTGYPERGLTQALAVLVYVNFFMHHWLPDLRLGLFLALAVAFRKTRIWFRVWQVDRWMPLLFGWLLVAMFIWLAENVSTFSHAWIYPSQQNGWVAVHPGKLGAWYLLMYVSFILVASLHGRTEKA